MRVWAQVKGSSPSKTFLFTFYFLLSQGRKDFSWFTCLKKENACFDVLCTITRLHSVKWRSLFGETATMQELLLKTCTSSAWRNEVRNETVTESCMGKECRTLSALADQPLRKLWKRRRRRRTSSNSQGNHRHLRQKCHWMTLTRVLYGGPSPACTPWKRFCQHLMTSE